MNLKDKFRYSLFGALVVINFVLAYQVTEKSLILYHMGNEETPKVSESKPVEKPVQIVKQGKKETRKSLFSGYSRNQILSWHSKRYGVSESPKPFVLTTYKGKMIKRSELEKTIRAVFQRLPHMKTSSHLVELLIETSEVETLRGIESKNTVSSATGLFQIMPKTAKDTLSWLKVNHKDVYNSLMDMYDRKLSLKDNLYHNIPFSIGLSATYFWRMVPGLWNKIDTQEKRANLWADVYNTPLDPQGTAKFYIKQVRKVKNKKV